MPTLIDISGMGPRFIRPELLCSPNVPRPLHGVAPRVVLGQDWWDMKRKAAYLFNNNCCWACGVLASWAREKPGLEGHEAYDIDYKTGRVELREVVALCHFCHSFIHCGRLRRLLEQGEITDKKFLAVISHGLYFLKSNGLFPHWHFRVVMSDGEYTPTEEECPAQVAPWDEWHLVVDGQRFECRSKESWNEEFGD